MIGNFNLFKLTRSQFPDMWKQKIFWMFTLDYHQDTVKSPVSSIYEVSTSKAEAASLLHSYIHYGA